MPSIRPIPLRISHRTPWQFKFYAEMGLAGLLGRGESKMSTIEETLNMDFGEKLASERFMKF